MANSCFLIQTKMERQTKVNLSHRRAMSQLSRMFSADAPNKLHELEENLVNWQSYNGWMLPSLHSDEENSIANARPPRVAIHHGLPQLESRDPIPTPRTMKIRDEKAPPHFCGRKRSIAKQRYCSLVARATRPRTRTPPLGVIVR